MKIMLLTQRLIKHLREQIITGVLPPGVKINEIQMARDLGISRSPLREALRILENERLIANLPRKGSFVTSLSLEDFVEVYEAREMIEFYSIDLIKNRRISDLSRMASSLKQAAELTMPSVSDPPKRKLSYLMKVGDYHVKLVASAGNNKLIQFYETIYFNMLRYQFFYAYTTGINHYGESEHKDVMDWLVKERWREAKKTLKAHIDFFAKQMKDKISEGKGVK